MLKLAMAIGVLFVVMGTAVILSAEAMLSGIELEAPGTRYMAGTFRLLVGLVFFGAAKASRFPTAFRILGALGLLGGLYILLLPAENWLELVHWITGQGIGAYRFGGGAIGILLGALVIYGARPRRIVV